MNAATLCQTNSTSLLPLPHRIPIPFSTRSATTLYTSSVPTSLTAAQPAQETARPPPPKTQYKELPPAFWAVLGLVIAFIAIGCFAVPWWIHHLKRKRIMLMAGNFPNNSPSSITPPPKITVTPPSESEVLQRLREQSEKRWSDSSPSPIARGVHRWRRSTVSPSPLFIQRQQQQQQAAGIYSRDDDDDDDGISSPAPAAAAASSDPNTTTLLSRIRQLENPSILGSIPESTIMTVPSKAMGGTNVYWRDFAERRLQEARGRGEVVVEEEDEERNDGSRDGGGAKRVRWREREWAVLAGAGSESGVGVGSVVGERGKNHK
ncbi:MAG: hypothetical protein L6R41_006823 [Letrouitia leprolyta]|nr:MAG: hypothetical protein L6R41_006823 [Letrouitia leprolyta]